MQTNLVAQPKHQSKQNCFFKTIIPGIGQCKKQPNSKRRLSQFLRFLKIDINQPNQKSILSLSCINDTGAALSCGYSKYHLAIAKQFPAAVKAIYTATDKSYSPIKLCGVVRSSKNDTNTMVDDLPMVIKYYTPYKTM